ncbi:MAG TPA: glutamate--cysteine ligase [Nocardioidaceae bacterium]|nr:glutamate--cysteine ligase [Nocardioidaceae bacterium]
MRKIGVEEELMLVDPDTGRVTAVSAAALRAREDATERGEAGEDAPVDQELFLQQIETATTPCLRAEELAAELVRGRRAVGESARAAGAAAVAVPTPVLPSDEPTITPKQRYRRIRDEYGEMTRQALVCGMHMHVDVSGEEEAVRVMDGIRPWLPVLLAMSGNSPYWEGRDTCFASWRSQVWGRWPSSGPAEPFGSADAYRSTVGKMIEWGAAMDDGMLYLDARPSSSYPTVEIRVADVCTEVEDAVLIAILARALVETAASGPAPAEHWRSDLLRAATWRAARYGLSSTLVDPRTMELAPAREVFESLRAHTREALRESDDWDRTGESFERLLAQGTGAARQRAAHEVSGSVAGVVQDLVRRTEASWSPTADVAG